MFIFWRDWVRCTFSRYFLAGWSQLWLIRCWRWVRFLFPYVQVRIICWNLFDTIMGSRCCRVGLRWVKIVIRIFWCSRTGWLGLYLRICCEWSWFWLTRWCSWVRLLPWWWRRASTRVHFYWILYLFLLGSRFIPAMWLRSARTVFCGCLGYCCWFRWRLMTSFRTCRLYLREAGRIWCWVMNICTACAVSKNAAIPYTFCSRAQRQGGMWISQWPFCCCEGRSWFGRILDEWIFLNSCRIY